MSRDDPYHDNPPVHRIKYSHRVTGAWSPLCYKRPKAAPSWASGNWTGVVTCPKCLKLILEQQNQEPTA